MTATRLCRPGRAPRLFLGDVQRLPGFSGACIADAWTAKGLGLRLARERKRSPRGSANHFFTGFSSQSGSLVWAPGWPTACRSAVSSCSNFASFSAARWRYSSICGSARDATGCRLLHSV